MKQHAGQRAIYREFGKFLKSLKSNDLSSLGLVLIRLLPAYRYGVTGDGFRLSAYVCSKTGAPLYFSIFDGCGANNCIGYPDSVVASACNNEEPVEFSFDTFNDDLYLIHIRAEDEVHFTLTVTQSSASRFVANLAMVTIYTISVSLSNLIL
jgi:hypothetical protein